MFVFWPPSPLLTTLSDDDASRAVEEQMMLDFRDAEQRDAEDATE